MTLYRRLSTVAWLAWRRLRARAVSALLVWLGIAAAAAMLASVEAGALVAQDRSLSERIASLQPSVRALRALSFGAPGQLEVQASLDRLSRGALSPILDRQPVATVLYRETSVAGSFLGIGAVDGLGRWIALRSGRLPRPCRPRRCEVLQLRDGRIPNMPGLRLVVVGRAELTSDVLFGDAVPPTREALPPTRFLQGASSYHRPAPAPLVLAEGVRGLIGSPLLDSYRTYGWVVPIDPDGVHPWTVGSVGTAVGRARSTLAASSFSLDLTAPGDELVAAADASHVAGRRLLLLGGQASALLVAFAVLAATRSRRSSEAARRRLVWLGTPRWLIALLTVVELAVLATAATAVGWAVGAGVGAAAASRAGSPPGGILLHSVLAPGGLGLAAGLAAAVTGILALALTVRPVGFRDLSFSPLDFAAVAAVAVGAVALARGQADADALLRQRGTGVVLLLLPGLIAFAAAVACARVFAPLLRLLERALPARRVSLRFAALSLARHPGYAAIAIGFLVVSIGLALFAETYRSTLQAGQSDQAGFTLPADFVVREDLTQLVPVRRVATPERLGALGGDASVRRVTRLTTSIRGFDRVTGITLLGLDPSAVTGADGWRDDFSTAGLDELARRIAPDVVVAARGPRVPLDARALTVRAGTRGRPITMVASIEARSGDFLTIRVGDVGSRTRLVSTPLPPAARGGRIAALRLLPPPRLQEGGADAGVPARGVLTLGPLATTDAAGATTVVARYGDWIGVSGVREAGSTGSTSLRYTLTNQIESYFRPRQPTDGRALPVVLSPGLAGLAGRDGVLPLELAGQRIPVRVAGTAERFPRAGEDFVVADRRTLTTALNAAQPGAAFVNELWINAPSEARRVELGRSLRRAPFDLLALRSHEGLTRALEREPIGRASLLMLASAAVVALLLALLGLLLGTSADLRDERRELFDLEAQGAGPAALRRQIRFRALVTAVFGLVGGLVTGILLSLVVVRLVVLTASATRPEPPLVLSLDWPLLGAALAVAVLLAALLVAGTTGAAFRSQRAGRVTQEGL